jgi:hypothetical protein
MSTIADLMGEKGRMFQSSGRHGRSRPQTADLCCSLGQRSLAVPNWRRGAQCFALNRVLLRQRMLVSCQPWDRRALKAGPTQVIWPAVPGGSVGR